MASMGIGVSYKDDEGVGYEKSRGFNKDILT